MEQLRVDAAYIKETSSQAGLLLLAVPNSRFIVTLQILKNLLGYVFASNFPLIKIFRESI